MPTKLWLYFYNMPVCSKYKCKYKIKQIRLSTTAQSRRTCCSLVSALYLPLSLLQKNRLCTFLSKLSRNKSLNHRQVAIEVCTSILQVLAHCQNTPQTMLDTLANCILARLKDKSSQVRTKALKCLSDLIAMFVKVNHASAESLFCISQQRMEKLFYDEAVVSMHYSRTADPLSPSQIVGPQCRVAMVGTSHCCLPYTIFNCISLASCQATCSGYVYHESDTSITTVLFACKCTSEQY